MTEPATGHRLLQRLQGVIDLVIALVQNRLALLGTECEALVWRLLSAVARGAAALLLLAFGLFFGAALLVAAFWDEHRLLALAGVSLAFLLAGAGCWWSAVRQLNAHGGLFSLTLQELELDRARFGGAGGGGSQPAAPSSTAPPSPSSS